MSSVQFLNALSVDDMLIDELAKLPFTSGGTRRICMHNSELSPLHVMLVESIAGSNFPRHHHADSDELSILIRGKLEVLAWENGADAEAIRRVLGPSYAESRAVLLPKNTPHTTKPIGGNCIYLEVKLGPFNKAALCYTDQMDPKGPPIF